MPQTSTIAFALIVGFIVFVTVRGELPQYLCVVGIGSNCSSGTVASGVVSSASKVATLISGLSAIPTIAV